MAVPLNAVKTKMSRLYNSTSNWFSNFFHERCRVSESESEREPEKEIPKLSRRKPVVEEET